MIQQVIEGQITSKIPLKRPKIQKEDILKKDLEIINKNTQI